MINEMKENHTIDKESDEKVEEVNKSNSEQATQDVDISEYNQSRYSNEE